MWMPVLQRGRGCCSAPVCHSTCLETPPLGASLQDNKNLLTKGYAQLKPTDEGGSVSKQGHPSGPWIHQGLQVLYGCLPGTIL